MAEFPVFLRSLELFLRKSGRQEWSCFLYHLQRRCISKLRDERSESLEKDVKTAFNPNGVA
jgi:hypothetical protein